MFHLSDTGTVHFYVCVVAPPRSARRGRSAPSRCPLSLGDRVWAWLAVRVGFAFIEFVRVGTEDVS